MTELPAPIVNYFAAVNAHDPDRATACFTPDAVVADDGHTRIGTDSIRQWIRHAIAQYRLTSEITAAEKTANAMLISVQTAGTFPGSPIDFKYIFTLAGNRISTLQIKT